MKRGYTTIEQSKRLLELGISPESADMYYRTTINGIARTADKPTIGSVITTWDIPCWTVSALLGVMPNLHKLQHTEHGYFCSLANYKHITKDYNNPIDACYEMVVWLIEKGYIKNK